MSFTALQIITDAYQRCNRLSPGETLGSDDAAFGFARLNSLVDEMSAQNQFLYQNNLTSAPVTGSITLGTGSWSAVAPGAEIVSATASNLALSPITMRQYNELYAPTTPGVPNVWAFDGLNTVYFYPYPSAITIKLQTLVGVSQFADQTTTYTAPDGFKSYMGAALAVRIAPNIIGKVPPELIRAETNLSANVYRYQPAILNVNSFNRPFYSPGRILFGG